MLRRRDEGTKVKTQPLLKKLPAKAACGSGDEGHSAADPAAFHGRRQCRRRMIRGIIPKPSPHRADGLRG